MRRPEHGVVLAVDPGGTVGYVYLDTGGRALEWGEERDWLAFCDNVDAVAPGLLALVVEQFTITRGRPMTAEPSALLQIGALRWIAHRADIPCIMQQPSAARAFGTAERLRPYKQDGLGRGGGGHAHSALAHGLLYLAGRQPLRKDPGGDAG